MCKGILKCRIECIFYMICFKLPVVTDNGNYVKTSFKVNSEFFYISIGSFDNKSLFLFCYSLVRLFNLAWVTLGVELLIYYTREGKLYIICVLTHKSA